MFGRLGKNIEQTDMPWQERVSHVGADEVDASNDYYPSLDESIIDIDSSDIGDNTGVYLPDPGEYPGKEYDIFSRDVGTATNTITVYDEGSSQLGNALDADNDFITVKSTGLHWRVMANSAA